MSGSVFLVEDDLDLLGLYELLLTTNGFRVWASCSTGESAITRYTDASELPDVVLLDQRLPGCSGLDVARAILAKNSMASIILATADDSVCDEALRLGIRRIKRKPFASEDLMRNISAAVAEGAAR